MGNAELKFLFVNACCHVIRKLKHSSMNITVASTKCFFRRHFYTFFFFWLKENSSHGDLITNHLTKTSHTDKQV